MPGKKAGARAGSRTSDVGAWLSLVEHLVRDQGVGGSNPLAPTIFLALPGASRLTPMLPEGAC